MSNEVARFPSQILFDAGLQPSTRICLALMYLRASNSGFCKLTARTLALWMDTTDTSIRRHWTDLRDAGYIESHTIAGIRHEKREIRGHKLALAPDGYANRGFRTRDVGTILVYEESE